MTTTTLSLHLLPRLSRIRRGSELHAEIRGAYRFVLPLVIGTALAIWLLREPLTLWLFSPEFLPLTSALGLQLIGDVLKIGSWVPAYTMISHARTRLYVVTEVIFAALVSLACIAGGILIVYANMGAAAGMDLAPKLITASLMAAPGALVISKIVFPETEKSETMGTVKLEVKSTYTNVIDAIGHGAGDGFKISMNVIAMLIGFIALIALIDGILGWAGHLFNPDFHLSLNWIFGKLFTPFAWAMGVPMQDVNSVATLLGQKLTVNEFVAFKSLTDKAVPVITEKGLLITSFAICGFANFSSVGMQIGGIGELAPMRRADLAQLGLKALFCGTLASYLSATIAGIIM